MLSRVRVVGRLSGRRWASSHSTGGGSAYEEAAVIHTERTQSIASTILGLAVPAVIFAIGYTSVKGAKWPDREGTPYDFTQVKKQLELNEDKEQFIKDWASESKQYDQSHWITRLIARNIPDREANNEALKERLKSNKEIAEKRLEVWAAPQRMPPTVGNTERGSAFTVISPSDK